MTDQKSSQSPLTLALLLPFVENFVRESCAGRRVAVSGRSELVRDLGLDSLSRMELLRAIERHFGIHLPESALRSATRVEEICGDTGMSAVGEAALSSWSTVSEDPLAPAVGPFEARSLIEVLDWHVETHPNKLHVRLLHEEGGPKDLTYRELYERSRARAGAILEAGIAPGECVALMFPTGFEFLETFYAVLIAGCIPVPLYPPAQAEKLSDHLSRQFEILKSCEATAFLTIPQVMSLRGIVQANCPLLRLVAVASDLRGTGPDLFPVVRTDAVALLQYTSGSTGTPKGVTLTHGNLLANIRAMGKGVQVRQGDTLVSWLPLYHDMGLIGAWLGSLYFGMPLVLMSPLAFLSRPERWLQAISLYRGTISAAPNFAYQLCADKLTSVDFKELDLTCWRIALNGAEPVTTAAMDKFAERFAPHGFARAALTPVYGLAENSLAVSFPPPGRGPRVDWVLRASLERLGEAKPCNAGDSDRVAVVGAGSVVDGHEVRIVDPSGQEVGDRIVGELQFRGPSSTSGYRGNADATSELFCDGWLRSGDLAYRVDGEIFITGRVKDLIIRAGRNIAPQDLEQVVALVSGVRAGGVGAFAVTTEQGEQIVVAVETKLESPADQAELIERIQQRLSSEMGLRADVVLPLKPRRLPKTSSGKIRRGDCRRLYSSGELGRSRSVAWQMVELSVRARGLRMMSWFRRAKVVSYGTWAGVSFIALLTILFLLLSLVQSTARRRSLLKRGAKLWFALIGIPLRVDGKEPSTTETIFVPNHASYLDAVVLTAVLPPTVRFVAKRDFEKHPLMRRLLKFADVVYVERSELGRAATDGAALYSVVRSGESIAIFPEGTFWRTPGLLPFRMGAFLMAARTGRSVTPVAIRGTRNILPDGNWLLRPGSITVTCLAALIPTGTEWGDAVRLRDAARERLLSAVGEPDRS